MEQVTLGKRRVGEGNPCYVVGEAGSNHDGKLEQAQRLIDVAADAGVDAVKFQLFTASKLYSSKAGVSDYLGIEKPIYDVIAEAEMPYEWVPDLAKYCEQRGVQFLASVFDEAAADYLDPFLVAHKIASYELNHLPLIQHVAAKKKPTIISTGAAELGEVREAVEAFLATGNDNLILLQCTASYPAPISSLNLHAMDALRREFAVPTGLSDHSSDPIVGPISAAALGANFLEKHFTLDRSLPGPDHRFALEPSELKLMVKMIREVEQALGSGQKVVHPAEAELRSFARRSIFAIRDIDVGDPLTPENIAVLRTGKLKGELHPKLYPTIHGQRAVRRISAGEPVRLGDYE